MIRKLQELEKERQVIYKTYRLYLYIGHLFLIMGIFMFVSVLFSFPRINQFQLIIPSFLFIGLSMVSYAIGNKKTLPFKKSFKKKIVQRLLEDNYDDVIYDPDKSISVDFIVETGLVSKPDRSSGEDYIKAKYKNVNIEASEFKLENRVTTTNANGGTTTSYNTYFLGRWFIFTFNKFFQDQLRITEKDFMHFGFTKKNFSKVLTESIQFNKKFFIESTSEQHAFYIITSKMIEQIMKIERKFNGKVSFLWRGNELHIAINDNKNILEPNLSKPLNDNTVKDYMPDIMAMASIIDSLGIDKQKYMGKHH